MKYASIVTLALVSSASAFVPQSSTGKLVQGSRLSSTKEASSEKTKAEVLTTADLPSELPAFFKDDRSLVEKVPPLFTKYDTDSSGLLDVQQARGFFSEIYEGELTLEELISAFQSIDTDVINISDKMDMATIMGVLRSTQRFPEAITALSNEGIYAGMLKAIEGINALEKKRVQGSLKSLSPYKDLLNIKAPESLGDNFDDFNSMDPEFQSNFTPLQLRCLALVSHNNMKGSMRKFVEANKNLLKKFRLTGTNSTMTMLKEVFGDDPTVVYGRSCRSGPLGGDAELVAAMCNNELGGMIFFQDPMESHMHSVDIECLNRQALIHNVMSAGNPTSAIMMAHTLRTALMEGKADLIPSFLFSLECPTVATYAKQQKQVIQANIDA